MIDRITNRALDKGKLKAKEAYEESIARALKDGAGPAHKITAIDHALPPLASCLRGNNEGGEPIHNVAN